ncbi:class I SAM-dependent methyltransferase [Nocardia gipuzkoensis]|uniref:class I SAM-dependent methyltransferase n=1 Tax=Nocardia gipuzkoensis TaxID=2749991 RepID=UPI00237D8C06|nr:class I SAM-dependent methyltransferase [Nocardia gipuzkoensis]MDE1675149.1 class I SAM-dependent methyltransferase [Nocardia gipuzkoensis]
MSGYDEYSPAAEYLHLLSAPMWAQLSVRLAAALADADPAAGTVVEFGAGTGLGTEVLLKTLPRAPVLVVEPSAHLRAVLLARLPALPGGERVTVFPWGAADLALPERIAAVIGMNMIGHLAPEVRRTLFADLVPRLAPGAPVVLSVQPPHTAEPVEVPPYAVAQGELRYEGSGRAMPVGPDRLRWTMTYRTLHVDREIARAVAEYDWWIVTADELADELAGAGAVVKVDGDLVIARGPGR